MRTILYFIACICAIFAFALLLYPIVSSLGKFRDGFALLMTASIVSQVAPIAIALAVIPLCLAFAFDRASSTS